MLGYLKIFMYSCVRTFIVLMNKNKNKKIYNFVWYLKKNIIFVKN